MWLTFLLIKVFLLILLVPDIITLAKTSQVNTIFGLKDFLLLEGKINEGKVSSIQCKPLV